MSIVGARPMGRIAAVGLVLAALIGIGAGAARAEAPAGPRLAYLRWDLYSGPEQVRLDSAAADGSGGQLLAGGPPSVVPLPDLYAGISWSPDGASLAFVSGDAPDSPRYVPGSIYVVPADGGPATEVPGSEGASDPVFAPDGHSLAVERTRTRWSSPRGSHSRDRRREVFEFSVWLLGLEGGLTRRLTGWHRKAVVPASFTPDGKDVAMTRVGGGGRKDAVAISLDGSESRLIAANASNPVYSPDGTKLALVRQTSINTDIFVGRSNGSHLRQISDGEAEHWPAWDPSGQRLAFVRYDGRVFPQSLLGIGDTMVEINADGSCEQRISTSPADAVFAPVWQPGPGRAAGRITC